LNGKKVHRPPITLNELTASRYSFTTHRGAISPPLRSTGLKYMGNRIKYKKTYIIRCYTFANQRFDSTEIRIFLDSYGIDLNINFNVAVIRKDIFNKIII
jgi:hypothetical protein